MVDCKKKDTKNLRYRICKFHSDELKLKAILSN